MTAGDPHHIGLGVEDFGDGAEGPGTIFVVAVEPGHDFAAGFGKALVQRIAMAGVGLADKMVQPVFVFLDDLHRAVGAAAIDHDIFEMRIILIQHRAQRVFDKSRLVEGRGDDGNPGAAHGPSGSTVPPGF